MTTKDYVLIADALYATAQTCEHFREENTLALAAVKIADALAGDNPRFDRNTFLASAIGVNWRRWT